MKLPLSETEKTERIRSGRGKIRISKLDTSSWPSLLEGQVETGKEIYRSAGQERHNHRAKRTKTKLQFAPLPVLLFPQD